MQFSRNYESTNRAIASNPIMKSVNGKVKCIGGHLNVVKYVSKLMNCLCEAKFGP